MYLEPHDFLALFIGQLVGYLVGGIPFGFLIAKAKAGIDIREHGSGNIGATNVGRVLGFRFFLLVFVLDFLKGAAPVLAAQSIRDYYSGLTVPVAEVVGFGAIMGHMFPIYLNLRGGKGVATTVGVIVVLAPWACLAGLAAWLLILLLTRMVSAASIAFAVTFATIHFLRTPQPFSPAAIALTSLVIAISLLVILRHRQNVARIIKGNEPFVRMPWERGK